MNYKSAVNLILIWVLFSLLAIAFIGTRPFVGLAIAVIGGIILGIYSFVDFEARQREEWAKHQQEMRETAGAPEGSEDDKLDQDSEEPSLEDDSG